MITREQLELVAFIAQWLGAIVLVGLLWSMERDHRKAKAAIDRLSKNVFDVLEAAHGIQEAQQRRIDDLAEALDLIMKHPAAPTLGVRVAKLELLLQTETSDTAKYRPTGGKMKGGTT